MKLRIVFTLAVLIFTAQSLFAQNSATKDKVKRSVDYKFAAVFYPFAALADNFRIGGEYKPSEEVGFRGIVNYGYGEDNPIYDGDAYSGIGGELQLRYYPTPGNPVLFTGFYTSMNNVTMQHVIYTNFTTPYLKEYNANIFSFGVLGGFQSTIAKRFIFDTYLGIGPNIPSGMYKEVDFYGQSTYRIPFVRKGMKFTFGINGGVILFK